MSYEGVVTGTQIVIIYLISTPIFPFLYAQAVGFAADTICDALLTSAPRPNDSWYAPQALPVMLLGRLYPT